MQTDLPARMNIQSEEHIAIILEHSMPRSRAFEDFIVQRLFDNVYLDEILFPGAKVLDLGLGSGSVLKGLVRDHRVIGYGADLVDMTGRSVPPITVVECNLEDGIPFESNTFDLVYGVQFLPYVIDKLGLMKETHRVTKVGGNVLLDATSRFGNQFFSPNIRKILEDFRNQDQIYLGFRRHPASQDPSCLKMIQIEKTEEGPLVFPQLDYATYLMDRALLGDDFVPQVSSVYSLS
jgi:SAM-dependent methyltransferase